MISRLQLVPKNSGDLYHKPHSPLDLLEPLITSVDHFVQSTSIIAKNIIVASNHQTSWSTFLPVAMTGVGTLLIPWASPIALAITCTAFAKTAVVFSNYADAAKTNHSLAEIEQIAGNQLFEIGGSLLGMGFAKGGGALFSFVGNIAGDTGAYLGHAIGSGLGVHLSEITQKIYQDTALKTWNDKLSCFATKAFDVGSITHSVGFMQTSGALMSVAKGVLSASGLQSNQLETLSWIAGNILGSGGTYALSYGANKLGLLNEGPGDFIEQLENDLHSSALMDVIGAGTSAISHHFSKALQTARNPLHVLAPSIGFGAAMIGLPALYEHGSSLHALLSTCAAILPANFLNQFKCKHRSELVELVKSVIKDTSADYNGPLQKMIINEEVLERVQQACIDLTTPLTEIEKNQLEKLKHALQEPFPFLLVGDGKSSEDFSLLANPKIVARLIAEAPRDYLLLHQKLISLLDIDPGTPPQTAWLMLKRAKGLINLSDLNLGLYNLFAPTGLSDLFKRAEETENFELPKLPTCNFSENWINTHQEVFTRPETTWNRLFKALNQFAQDATTGDGARAWGFVLSAHLEAARGSLLDGSFSYKNSVEKIKILNASYDVLAKIRNYLWRIRQNNAEPETAYVVELLAKISKLRPPSTVIPVFPLTFKRGDTQDYEH